ncbi:unnamed protein product [Scytosiphon promiscuus]
MTDTSGTFGCLTPCHEDLASHLGAPVRTYLKFVRAKRDIAMRSMEGEFDDINNDRLSEDMYSQEDVADILDSLRGCVVTNLRQEVGAVANMSALLMKQMLEDAEQQGAALSFDTSTVEDQALLEEVERMRVDRNLRRSSAQGSRLVSIKDEHARLLEEVRTIQAKNDTLEERLIILQQDCAALSRQRDEEKQQAEVVRQKLSFQAADKGQVPPKEFSGEKGTPEAVAALRELSALKALSEKRLNESPQFQQLKKLVSSKSQQVVSLRRRLLRYEPDDDDAKRQDAEDNVEAAEGKD